VVSRNLNGCPYELRGPGNKGLMPERKRRAVKHGDCTTGITIDGSINQHATADIIALQGAIRIGQTVKDNVSALLTAGKTVHIGEKVDQHSEVTVFAKDDVIIGQKIGLSRKNHFGQRFHQHRARAERRRNRHAHRSQRVVQIIDLENGNRPSAPEKTAPGSQPTARKFASVFGLKPACIFAIHAYI
jgi:hypothetical protein